jgi:hypothetical protein
MKLRTRLYDAGMLFLVCLLCVFLGTACAWSVGKKGIQASAGIARADAVNEVESEGFSEGGVEVASETVRILGDLAIAVLRMPFMALQGAADGALQPLDERIDE